jgi:hypothetical protein
MFYKKNIVNKGDRKMSYFIVNYKNHNFIILKISIIISKLNLLYIILLLELWILLNVIYYKTLCFYIIIRYNLYKFTFILVVCLYSVQWYYFKVLTARHLPIKKFTFIRCYNPYSFLHIKWQWRAKIQCLSIEMTTLTLSV